jgi:hypothetical protein
MLEVLPNLRAFAISLTGDLTRADDLVRRDAAQRLVEPRPLRAGHQHASLALTILRNHYLTEFRKRRREVEDADGAIAAQVPVQPEQRAVWPWVTYRGSVRARASKYRLSWDEANPGSCGLQDGQHGRGPRRWSSLRRVGGNVLMVAGARAEEVAQFIVSAAEPGGRSRGT